MPDAMLLRQAARELDALFQRFFHGAILYSELDEELNLMEALYLRQIAEDASTKSIFRTWMADRRLAAAVEAACPMEKCQQLYDRLMAVGPLESYVRFATCAILAKYYIDQSWLNQAAARLDDAIRDLRARPDCHEPDVRRLEELLAMTNQDRPTPPPIGTDSVP